MNEDEKNEVAMRQHAGGGDSGTATESARRAARRAALGRLAAAAQACHKRHDSQPVPGSQASREAEAAGPRGLGSRLERALVCGGVLLANSFDHLLGLEDLLAADRTVYAPRSVTRSVVDAAARAWWLLDPSIDERVRVARLLTEQLASDREYQKVATAAGRLTEATAAKADMQAVVELAEEHDFTELRDRSKEDEEMGAPRAVDAERLSSTDLIKRVFATAGTAGLGELGWRFFSTAVHGTLWGLAQAQTVEAHPTWQDVLVVSAHATRNDVRDMVMVAAAAFVLAFNSQINLYGWDRCDWDARIGEVFTALSS
jgi:hypothetical protein